MKVKVIKKDRHLILVDQNDNPIGKQTGMTVVDDVDELDNYYEVSVTFKVHHSDFMPNELRAEIRGCDLLKSLRCNERAD